jgi:hypothetical protein
LEEKGRSLMVRSGIRLSLTAVALCLPALAAGLAMGAAPVEPLPPEPGTGDEVDLTTAGSATVGTVSVEVIGDEITVTVTSTGGWALREIQLHVAGSLEGIPQTKKGNPKPGHFDFKADPSDPFEEIFVVSLDKLGLSPDEPLVLALHADVEKQVDGETLSEGAWVGEEDFPGKSKARYLELN